MSYLLLGALVVALAWIGIFALADQFDRAAYSGRAASPALRFILAVALPSFPFVVLGVVVCNWIFASPKDRLGWKGFWRAFKGWLDIIAYGCARG